VTDEEEIRALIGAHFDALGWKEGGLPDQDRFRADFPPEAALYGAVRPAVKRGPLRICRADERCRDRRRPDQLRGSRRGKWSFVSSATSTA